MTEPQREQVWSILRAFNCYLPAKALEARMNRLKSVQEETYFAWIGGYGLGDPYYFRIHSPMTFSEVSVGPSWGRFVRNYLLIAPCSETPGKQTVVRLSLWK